MKRFLLCVLFSLLMIVPSFAGAHMENPGENPYAMWIGLTPREGAYGVNLTSSKYRADLAESGAFDNFWVSDSENRSTLSNLTATDVADGKYTDENIIAVGSLNAPGGVGNSLMTVTFDCSNTELAFVSESRPTYKRPFELILFIVYQNARGENNVSWSNGNSVDVIKIDSSKLGKPIKINAREGIFEDDGIDGNDNDGTLYEYVHFDLVLALPDDSDDRSVVEYKGFRYPLIEEDDYTASVTIKIEAEGAINTPQVITIPFSGFYRQDADDNEKLDDTINLSINRLPAATNLDLATLSSTSGVGPAIEVAEIDMMLYVDDNDGENPYDANDVKMFFSASNDPQRANSRGFEFTHSSVDYSSIHNAYNSIGYTISTKSYEESTQYNHGPQVDGSSDPTKDVKFYGNEKISTLSSDATISREGTLGSGDSLGFIYPAFHKAYTFQQDYYELVGDAGLTIRDRADSPKWYYSWHGDVYLQFNQRKVENMFAGRYTSTVYFHVVAP